ncbi:hypothetical protein ZWY2020_022518 [Hordeum vulgare]|nr:hypothetical protein ZWY2020_022518 [Hordeum vulgare]
MAGGGSVAPPGARWQVRLPCPRSATAFYCPGTNRQRNTTTVTRWAKSGRRQERRRRFLKIAKEKTDDVAEGAKETAQETKEAVLGRSDDEGEVQAAGRAGGTIRSEWQLLRPSR